MREMCKIFTVFDFWRRMAEAGGFLRLCSGQASHLLIFAEAEGFEPSYPLRDHAFQACAIDHYATLPRLISYHPLIKSKRLISKLIDIAN